MPLGMQPSSPSSSAESLLASSATDTNLLAETGTRLAEAPNDRPELSSSRQSTGPSASAHETANMPAVKVPVSTASHSSSSLPPVQTLPEASHETGGPSGINVVEDTHMCDPCSEIEYCATPLRRTKAKGCTEDVALQGDLTQLPDDSISDVRVDAEHTLCHAHSKKVVHGDCIVASLLLAAVVVDSTSQFPPRHNEIV